MLVMFSAFLLILGSYYHNLPFHNNKEAFLALVGVLKHVSDVHDVHTPKKTIILNYGIKKYPKKLRIYPLALQCRSISLRDLTLSLRTWGDNVIENLEGGEQLVDQLEQSSTSSFSIPQITKK